MTYFKRAQWGARAARGGPGNLSSSTVEGIALHWPAMKARVRGVGPVSSALRGWQAYHMDTHGWSDIGYQEAIDQDGHVYELRGLARQSGANGNTDLNRRFGALLLVLAPGEHPTEEMIASVRARIAVHRTMFPQSRRIVGHGQIRPGGTECPGPITQGLINAGTFEPVAAKPVVRNPRPVKKALATGRKRANQSAKSAARARDRAERQGYPWVAEQAEKLRREAVALRKRFEGLRKRPVLKGKGKR